MKPGVVDLEKLRVALRRMPRGDLLLIAERAIELVSTARLGTLVGDMVPLDQLIGSKGRAASLLDEVRKFHDAGLRGEYYDSFDVNSRNFMEKSRGTEAFIAEFDRLIGKCIRAAGKGPRASVREAFELLFALLRRIDEDPDSVIFFADEAGAWQVGVDWHVVLPVYFKCLAESAPGELFAREVDRTISDFAHYERPHHLASAHRVANAEQEDSLRRLPARD